MDPKIVHGSSCMISFGLVLMALVCCGPGCRRPPEAPAPGVVATVDDEHITAKHLREAFWYGPDDVRRRALQRGGRHALLDYTIGDFLLHREALKRGLHPRFAHIFPHHERLMKQFLDAEFEPTVNPSDVPEEAVRRQYERIRPTLERPETVRIEMAYYRDREKAAEGARRLLRAQQSQDDDVYEQVMRLEADAWPEASPTPQLGIFTFEEAARFYGDEIAQRAFAHDESDMVHPEPVALLEGWVVMVVPNHHPAEPAPSFEEVEAQVRDQAFSDFRDEALDRFVDSFLPSHTVEVHYENLEMIPWVVDLPEPEGGLTPPSSALSPPQEVGD